MPEGGKTLLVVGLYKAYRKGYQFKHGEICFVFFLKVKKFSYFCEKSLNFIHLHYN